MQIKTSSGNDLDGVVLVDANGTPYTASAGGGGGTTFDGKVTGNIASGIADAGAPVKIGGKSSTGVPNSQADGNRVDTWHGTRGNVIVGGQALNPTDGLANLLTNLVDHSGGARPTSTANFNYNPATTLYDRQRGDTTGTFVVNKPVTAGGTTTFRVVSAASTNTGVIKATPGQAYGIQLSNSSASWRFLKLYNKTNAPVLASDVPVEIVGIPPGGRVEMNRHLGMPFSAGIAIAITGAYADTDTTVTATGEVVGSIQYF